MTHRVLPPPPRSLLRKMSPRIQNRHMNQAKNRKNSNSASRNDPLSLNIGFNSPVSSHSGRGSHRRTSLSQQTIRRRLHLSGGTWAARHGRRATCRLGRAVVPGVAGVTGGLMNSTQAPAVNGSAADDDLAWYSTPVPRIRGRLSSEVERPGACARSGSRKDRTAETACVRAPLPSAYQRSRNGPGGQVADARHPAAR